MAQSGDLIPELSAPHLDLRPPSSRPSPYRDKLGAARQSRFHLDREIKLMGIFQGAAETIDGCSSWKFSHQRLYYVEGDPISRFFIGEKPGSPSGIARMAVFGTAENIGAAYLSQAMRHSHHKFLRAISYGIQPAFAGIHLSEGIRNLHADLSLCNPGFFYNGSACVPKH
jgi:hypothetical protein